MVDTQTHAHTGAGPCSVPPAPTLTNKLIKAHSYASNTELLIYSIQQWRKAGMTTINSDFTSYKSPINKNKCVFFSLVQVKFVPFRSETEQLTQDPCTWLKKYAKQKCKMPFCQFWKWMNAKVSAKASASAELHWAPKAISQQADKLMSLKTTRGGAIFQVMIHKKITFMLKIWHEMKLSSSLSTSKHKVTSRVRKRAFTCTNSMIKKTLLQFLCCWFF